MSETALSRNRNFRLIFAASTVSHLGSGVSAVAFPWFASLLTRDPLLIGFVAMAPQLPWLLFALPFGVLTDRLDHRRTIVASDGVRAALTLLVAVLALEALSGSPAVLLLAVAALLIAGLTVLRAAPRAVQRFWPALQEGVGWLWRHGPLRRLALVLGAYNFLSAMIWSVMVLYAQDILRLNAVGYGTLLSALAAGGLGGSLAAPWIIGRAGPSRALLLSIAGFILSSAVLIFTTNPWIAGAALMGDACTGMIWNIVTVSYRQRHIPPELLGRVNAAYRFVGSGTLPLGSLAGGTLVAVAAPLGSFALHLPFVAATVGAMGMLAYAALRLRLE